MKTVFFVVLGIFLIIVFLAWFFLVKPGKDGKWMVLILDGALIVVSALVLTTGFMMRDKHITDSAAAWNAQGDGGGSPEADDGQSSDENAPQRLQEDNAQKPEGGGVKLQEPEESQETGEEENPQEGQGAEGTQGATGTQGSQGEGQGSQDAGGESSQGTQDSQETEGSQESSQEAQNSQEPNQGNQDAEDAQGTAGAEESQESGQGD